MAVGFNSNILEIGNMRSVKVTLARTTEDGQFRVSALSRGSDSSLPVDTDTWNLVTQVLRLKGRPSAPSITDFILNSGILNNDNDILG